MAGQTDNHVKRARSEGDNINDGESKRRRSGDESASFSIGIKDTVYCYLCPARKVGSIIGRGGEIVKQLRADSGAKINIGDSKPGCEERVVTICSSSDEADTIEAMGDYVCPAQDALFKVHEKVIGSEAPEDEEVGMILSEVSARLLVPSDQIGYIIGKGGQTIHGIRNDSGAYVQIFKDNHVPSCASCSDELVQITGEAPSVKKALFQISSLLHGNSARMHSETSHSNVHDDTVYRFLCLERNIGSIIGRGGEIMKQVRADSQAKISVGERISGCKERVVTIFSSSEKTNTYGDTGDFVCPAQDALFRLHEKLLKNDLVDDEDTDMGAPQASVRLLVPSDQIGHIIGKGGHIVQDIRSNSGANVLILKDECLPPCANSGDEILQITGEAPNIMRALIQVSSCIRDKPSRTHRHLNLSDSHIHLDRGNASREWGASHHDKDESLSKFFTLRLLCPSANIARVIGKNGVTIKQIREQSGASIKVDTSTTEDDCIISISGKEFLEDETSSTIYAAVRLQPRCSEMIDREHGEAVYTTRLLAPTAQIGCLIGKGGSVINDMRRATRANIRIMSENLPTVASKDDDLIQISGELEDVRNALIQVSSRLKGNIFGKESSWVENSKYDGSQVRYEGRRRR